MKLILAALLFIVSSGSMAFAAAADVAKPVKVCKNGWAAFARCSNDPEHFIHICLDPSKTDGSAVVHTLDVPSSQVTEEVGYAYVSSRDQRIIVETNSPIFKNLTIQRLTATAAGGQRDYRPGVEGKSGDLSSFFCSLDDRFTSQIPVK